MSQVSAVRDRKFTALESPASPFSVDYPELVEAGDVLELLVTSQASNNTFTAAGWTSLARVDGISDVTAQKYWRTATGTEAGATFALSQGIANDIVCIVRAVRADLNPGTPESASAASGATFDAPSLTPTGGDRLYLWTVDGAIRFGSQAITAWDADLEERIQRVISGIGINAVGSERLLEAASYDPPGMAVTNSTWGAFTTAIPVDAPPAGVFPVVEASSQGAWATSSTTQTLTLPAGVQVGDLLVATIAGSFSPTVTISGWDVVDTDAAPDSTVNGTILQRVADGTEGASVTVDLDPARLGSYVCRRISGADDTKTESASNPSAATNSPVWPDLTPTGGADSILWMAEAVNDATPRLAGWPVNFGAAPLLQQDGNTNTDAAAAGVGARDTTSVSPGTGLLSGGTARWVTFTVAIYPSASPPPPPSGGGNRMGTDRAIRKPPRTPR